MDTSTSSRVGMKSIFKTMDPTMRLLLVIGFLETTAVTFYATVLMPYYKSLGFESDVAGILTSILQIVSAVVLTGAGFAADRLGRKRLYTAGQIIRCLVAGSLLVTRNFAGLVMVSVLRGLASIQSPAQSAIIADYTKKSSRATTFALSQTFGQLAGFLFPLAAGAIADNVGVRVPFTIGLALAVAATVLGLRIKENGVAEKEAQQDQILQEHPATQSQPEPASWALRVRRMFTENDGRALWFILLANVANGMANGGTNILLPYTVMDKFSSAYSAISGVQATGALGTMLVLLIGGRIADSYGRKGIIIWSSLLFPIVLCSVFFLQSIWQLYAMMLAVTMAGNISTPAIQAIHVEVVRDQDRASFAGLVGGVCAASLALGSALGGFGYSLNASWSWAVTIILFGSQGALYYLALTRREKQVATQSQHELA